jgi:hypothetical protein
MLIAMSLLASTPVGDVDYGTVNATAERRVRPAGSARQRRNEAGQRREGVTVELPKVD